MFSEDEKRQIYQCSRYLVKALQPTIGQRERRSTYTWLAQSVEAGCFETKDEGLHRMHGLILQLEVACLVARELGLDAPSILAVLLYRPFAKGLLSSEEITSCHGAEVVRLLQLLTRTSELYMRREAISSENFHNLLISMAEDMRVVLIIIADRLYLLRHAKSFYTEEARTQLASEISFLYAPIAHRLGLYTIKGEMEDLCLRYLQPKTYGFITRKLGETKAARDAYIAAFITPVRERLRAELSVPFEMKGRVKSISSINNKLKKLPFEDIYDLFAIRVTLDVPLERERQVCWQVYSIITDMYRPNPERLKDWISIPKSNGYESLHTTVLGPENRWVEVQIRTKRMDVIAERGVAAHWRYKGIRSEHGLDDFLASVREALEAVRDTSQEDEKRQTLESSLLTLKAREIYVFTPKGDVLALSSASTPVDFAYAVHTEVGHRTVGARVNGRLVPLDTRLENGDTVEVFTSKAQGAGPSRDWLTFVGSTRARNKIRSWFSKERREEAIEAGKNAIARAMRKKDLPIQRLMSHDSLMDVAQTLDKGDIDGLYAAVGEGHVSAQHVVETLVNAMGGEAGAEETLAEGVLPTKATTGHHRTRTADTGVIVDGMDEGDVYVKLARCCTPMPGDPIIGFITRGSGISVHRSDCQNVDQLKHEPERILSVHWAEHAQSAYLVQVEVEALDRGGLLADITRVLADNHVNLMSATIGTSRDRVVTARFVVELAEAGHLDYTLSSLRRIDGVFEARRTTSTTRRHHV